MRSDIILARFTFCLLLLKYSLSVPKRSKSIDKILPNTFNKTSATDKGGRNDLLPFVVAEPTSTEPQNRCDIYRGWTCTPYYKCATIVANNQEEKVNLRSGIEENTCPLHLEVCCRKRNVIEGESILPRTSVANEDDPELQQCGLRKEEGVGVSISGIKDNGSQFGEFPWMTAILRFELITFGSISNDITLYICSGSLVSPNIVLTAAHCVDGYVPANLKIRVGEWDTQQTYELLPHQERNIQNIITHPNFNRKSLKHDIALLEFDNPVKFTPHVGTICLPSANTNYLDYHTCYATGWGKDTFEGSYQNILKRVKLDLVEHSACQKALRTTRLGRFFRLDNSFTCAGGISGEDTCKGDGGGPLVCNKLPGGAFEQVGVVAWGIGCGEEGIPGVYADVSKDIDWINLEMSIISEFKFISENIRNDDEEINGLNEGDDDVSGSDINEEAD